MFTFSTMALASCNVSTLCLSTVCGSASELPDSLGYVSTEMCLSFLFGFLVSFVNCLISRLALLLLTLTSTFIFVGLWLTTSVLLFSALSLSRFFFLRLRRDRGMLSVPIGFFRNLCFPVYSCIESFDPYLFWRRKGSPGTASAAAWARPNC